MKIDTKKSLHSRNYHNNRYDFEELIKSDESLKAYVSLNKYNDLSIDFSNPQAVLALNRALLIYFYNIKEWKIPKNYLCPPIPGRADYIHYIADLLSFSNDNKIPKNKMVKGLDIGIGANAIYPIVGNSVYGWSFVGSDIDEYSLQNVSEISSKNEKLNENLECRRQFDKNKIFDGIIKEDDRFDFTLCNPPFHKSAIGAQEGSKRKVSNLKKQKVKKATLNFGGKSNELWCDGGELMFIKKMINESINYSTKCLWFTTLVSKKENLDMIYGVLKKVNPIVVKTIQMKQGQKVSRFVAWTFLTKKEHKKWNEERKN